MSRSMMDAIRTLASAVETITSSNWTKNARFDNSLRSVVCADLRQILFIVY